MRKTFKDLKLGDEYYSIHPEHTEWQAHIVTQIQDKNWRTSVEINNNTVIIEDMSVHFLKKTGYYSQSVIIFANKSDLLRYSKAQCFKRFDKLKQEALNAIASVKQHRAKYIDLLNNEYTERVINELENIKNQSI